VNNIPVFLIHTLVRIQLSNENYLSPRSKAQSNNSTSREIPSSYTRTVSKEENQNLAKSNETNGPSDVELQTEDKDTRRCCIRDYLPYQHEYNLLGLALQTSTTSLLGNKKDTSEAAPQAIFQVHKSTCPALSHTLASAEGEVVQLEEAPLDRYLAEGLSERYALVNISTSDAVWKWARYPDCLCGE
jgi:hypothetical protein